MSLKGAESRIIGVMIVRLDTHRLQTLDQVRELLAGSTGIDLQSQRRAEPARWPAAPLSEQGDRSVTGAGHPPAAPTPDHRRDHRPARRSAPAVRPPLHPRRHRVARRDGRAARHAVRPGHGRPLCARLASVRRRPLRAPGPDLQRPPVQPAALDDLCPAPRGDPAADPPGTGRDWGTPPPAAVRTARLGPGRYGPPSAPASSPANRSMPRAGSASATATRTS